MRGSSTWPQKVARTACVAPPFIQPGPHRLPRLTPLANRWTHCFGLAESGAVRKNMMFYSAGFEQDFVHAPYYSTYAPQAPSGPTIPAPLGAQQGEIVERQSPTSGFGRLDWVASQH